MSTQENPFEFIRLDGIESAGVESEAFKSLCDAAAEKEFYDQSHFSKYFKTVVGVKPSEYKSSVRNFLQCKSPLC